MSYSDLLRKVIASQVEFSPLLLFKAGQYGAWYDPSDILTLFQDDSGTTPVTADGQGVGFMLDKSGNGNHLAQPDPTRKPVYRTDGTYHWLDFDGSNDVMQADGFSMDGKDQISIFSAIRRERGNATEVAFAFTRLSSNFTALVFRGSGSRTTMRCMTSTGSYDINTTTTFFDEDAVFFGNHISSDEDNTFYVNSNFIGDIVSSGTISNDSDLFYLGSDRPTGLHWQGRFYGFVAVDYNAENDRKDVEEYLANKSGAIL